MVARETATCSRRHFGDESFFTLSHFAAEMLAARDDTLEGKTCLISGSGNVAQHTAEKIIELGGKVLTLSDSSGYIYDPEGIDSKKLLFAPAKAANAGGMAVSGLEMAQNRMLLNWSAKEVDHEKYPPDLSGCGGGMW